MSLDQRALFVHAHPDDETINNGATMARYVAEGRGVTVVTCTAGEMGEVLVPDLLHLSHERDGGLGAHRRGEIADALAHLGVTDHRWLGGFGRFHDSGMAWHADGHAVAAEVVPDNAFWHADLTEAADELVKVIRELRPQVLVTYNEFGGYGHPDHIQAHRVAMYAASLAAAPAYKLAFGEPHDIAKIYWCAISESRMRQSLRQIRESGDTETFEGMDPDGEMGPFVTPDEQIAACVDGTDFVHTKMDALKLHRTQVDPEGFFFSGAESGHAFWGEEFYVLAKGRRGQVGEDGLETDLFAGL
ncbi:N-acetyl-1-D-myo-inositol-2-amino-2-deoxy-alpha-D-glucopyranoside deacetylase [Nocardioides piscis]|uniref:1D-myo-inositol 2-acetamido-2-deoxy-alpha-D-glucopyranoside deacetylase n=1 Tax=Nocardioides piscis TaxID=2714938 RepID=A0A6G7YBG1_9ACTN|nr:N-acetyl-1-D-myo-inositol-2-amino-2-deoxy-alpha-D-glucopyranoside deacetylase [Nocardioides piscis]QIK74162.1 N-acetyl-1-D-myo-inositol-2-amino-2-deoxy-alpha-D-glucopyranoside deacetylase [Nocardioides piscis]